MLREEAIEALTSKDVHNSDIMLEALDMAVKALEKEPCNDCISREQAIKTIEKFCPSNCVQVCVLKELPPVTLQEPILDKIRAEMEHIKKAEYQIYGKGSWRFVDKCLEIIDKYKAKSEETE